MSNGNGPDVGLFAEPPQLESWGGREGELPEIYFKPITPLVLALTTRIAVAQVDASAARKVGVFAPEAISYTRDRTYEPPPERAGHWSLAGHCFIQTESANWTGILVVSPRK